MPDLMPEESSALVPSSRERVVAAPSPAPASADQGVPVQSSPPSHVNGQAIVKRRPTRVKAPKDSKVYKVVLAVVALRAQGVKMKEISETLGYSEDVLRQYVSRAYKRGWLNISSFDQVDDQLEYVLKHKIVRNVSEFLDDRDKDVTLEAAKGLGMFKTHQVVKGENVTTVGVALRVQVEMPPVAPSTHAIAIRPGTIGGAHGIDVPEDAEIVETEE